MSLRARASQEGEQASARATSAAGKTADEDGVAVAHGAMDAPEVDPRTFVHAPDASTGDRVAAQVSGVTEEGDLVAEV